ncbi:hypothetical protein [Streptomyces broussonetiae]|uniref:hypothetical protein n=1 Tax=Streptomyces broussonetiae TaxID=2686304 RepID=UPI0035D86E89
MLDAVAHEPDGRQCAFRAQQIEPHGDGRLAADAVQDGLVKHNVTKVGLEDINENLEALGRGDVVGCQVVVFE